MRFRFRKHGLLFVVLLGLMIPLFGTTVMERFSTTIDNHSKSVEYIDPRVSTWTMGFEILKSNMWLGIGPGRFQTEVSKYPLRENSPVGSCGDTPCVVHNTFLQISTSGGIFAGALYLLMLTYIFAPGLLRRFATTARLAGLLLFDKRTKEMRSSIGSRTRAPRFNVLSTMDKSDLRYYSGDVIRASILGLTVCGVLLDLMLFDAFYLLAILFVVRSVLVERESALLRRLQVKPRKKKRKSNKWGYSPATA